MKQRDACVLRDLIASDVRTEGSILSAMSTSWQPHTPPPPPPPTCTYNNATPRGGNLARAYVTRRDRVQHALVRPGVRAGGHLHRVQAVRAGAARPPGGRPPAEPRGDRFRVGIYRHRDPCGVQVTGGDALLFLVQARTRACAHVFSPDSPGSRLLFPLSHS